MPARSCPRCGSAVLSGDGLAQSAVALLMPAPAVSDMATQQRCPHCQHLFAAGDVRYQDAAPWRAMRRLALAAGALAMAWAVGTFFWP